MTSPLQSLLCPESGSGAPRVSLPNDIPQNYIHQGAAAIRSTTATLQSILSSRRLPPQGLSPSQIRLILSELSLMDSNNNPNNVGVGEREGRIYSSLIESRSYGLSHGVGRSGDLSEPQPKAAGSSVLAGMATVLAGDALKVAGLDFAQGKTGGGLLIVPCCTGMTLALTLATIRLAESGRAAAAGKAAGEAEGGGAEVYPVRDDVPPKSVVLWSRIDQKSCVKAVQSLGLTLLVVPTKKCPDSASPDADGLTTDVDAFKSLLYEIGGPSKVLALISTTSCFAPRLPDDVVAVASFAALHSLPHVVNDAYGLQCPATCLALNRAARTGRVDAVVCSLDKNFLVPVGGALVFGPRKDVVDGVAANYPGRASAAPALDLFVTLLEMGEAGYRGLLDRRVAMLEGFREGLARVAAKHGERVLQCKGNTISFGVTLCTIPDEHCGMLGSMLFSRCCSGCRVVVKGSTKDVGGVKFKGFGSSHDEYGVTYLTAACAIGMKEEEAKEFFDRLDKCFADVKKKISKKDKKDKGGGGGGGGGENGGGEAV